MLATLTLLSALASAPGAHALHPAARPADPPRAELELRLEAERRLRVDVGYFGERLVHPGVALGVEWVFTGDTHGLFFAGSFSAHHRPNEYTGFLLGAFLGYRYTSRPGFFLEARLGAGPLILSPLGATSARDTWSTLSLQAGAGVGWDFSGDEGPPLSVFLRGLGFGGERRGGVQEGSGAIHVGFQWHLPAP